MNHAKRIERFEGDPTELELALNGPGLSEEDPVSRQRWEALREDVWELWQEQDKTWPPDGASRWDGIKGEILSRRYGLPREYENDWDARPSVVKLAQRGIVELEAASERARAAVPPRYLELLNEALEHPEARIGAAR